MLGLLAAAGCGSGSPEPPPVAEGPSALEQSEQGNFTLYVSNQSFERGNVDIRVLIDGRPAVAGDFAVEGQHNWIEYRFELADGLHSLHVESMRGEALLDKSFKVEGERWAVVDYWCCAEAGDPKFTFLIRGQPIAFA
jgi:hypothetical protein